MTFGDLFRARLSPFAWQMPPLTTQITLREQRLQKKICEYTNVISLLILLMERCSLRLPYPRGSPTFGLVGALLFCKAADSSNKENRESRHSKHAYCFHINVSHARKLTVDRTIRIQRPLWKYILWICIKCASIKDVGFAGNFGKHNDSSNFHNLHQLFPHCISRRLYASEYYNQFSLMSPVFLHKICWQ